MQQSWIYIIVAGLPFLYASYDFPEEKEYFEKSLPCPLGISIKRENGFEGSKKVSVTVLVPDSNLLLLVLYRVLPFPSTKSRFLLVYYES